MDLVGFCGIVKGGVWETKLPNGFGAFTPCITNIIILTISHLVLSSTTLYRIYLLITNCSPHPRSPFSLPLYLTYLLIFLATVMAFEPVRRLTFHVSLVNLDGQPSLSPHEIVTLIFGSFTWCIVIFMLALETRFIMKDSQYYVGFAVLYVAVGNGVMLQFQIMIRQYYTLDLLLLCAGYLAFQVAFGFIYLLSAIRSRPFNGYVLLPSPESTMQENLTAKEKTCPKRHAHFISRALFTWVTPLIRLGYKRTLTEKDIWILDSWDQTEELYRNFQNCWDREHTKDRSSLLRSLHRCLGIQFWLSGLFKAGCDSCQFVGPIFLNILLQSLQRGDPAWHGYTCATLMFIGVMFRIYCESQYYQNISRVGFHIRSMMVAAVFNKTLRLSHEEHKNFTSGRITNLMTMDIEAIQTACGQVHSLWSAPACIVVAVYLLYTQLGFVPVSSALLLLMLLPLQIFVVSKMQKFYMEGIQWTDKRISLMNEILSSMDILKCYAWEESFSSKILAIRVIELSCFKKGNISATANSFILQSVPVLIAGIAFGLYSMIGGDLTPAKAFTSISLFSIIKFPLYLIPNIITQMVNANVSLKRVQDFLLSEEYVLMLNPPIEDGLPAITIKKGNFSWNPKQEKNTLSGIELDIGVGSFIAIVGGTGQGKSSLISAILGEIPAIADAQVVLRGKVAYVPQVSWIFNGTVRENVLFGCAHDSVRYKKAIHGSALEQDIQYLHGGDNAEIGERGVNISGGQKQRVSIARAIYADADVYIFDDPLSALDAHVACQVFEKCLLKELHNKTRVLVTNQLHFLSHVDKIYLVHDGMIKEQGTYDEIMKTGPLFRELMVNSGKVENEGQGFDDKNPKHKEKLKGSDIDGEDPDLHLAAKTKNDWKSTLLVKEEERKTGVVGWNTLCRYANASGGYWVILFLEFLYIISEIARLSSNTFLSKWSDPLASKSHGPFFYTSVYTLLCSFQILAGISTSFWVIYSMVHASRALHNEMLFAVFRAPMLFFHSNPLGRIINRFAKDTGDLDRNVLPFTSMFLASITQLLSTFVLIGVLSPVSLWAIAPLFATFQAIYTYYQSSAREVKRLDSITRSPVYAQLGETLNGLATIRAYKAYDRSSCLIGENMDNNVRFTLVAVSVNRWMAVRLELLGGLMIWLTSVFAVLSNWQQERKEKQSFSPALMGLLLSYTLNITELMTSTLNLASLAENSFNAIERIGDYVNVDPEAQLVVRNHKPPTGWPTEGSIEFRNVTVRYRPNLRPSLLGLSLHILPNEKVGVVGRTGAGKSSMFNALFRIVEPESGSMLIDGLDISEIGLHDLRKSLGIIPQVPVLFSGTVQFNLDPFNEHSDMEIWEVLERAHLKDVISKSPLGLQKEVTEGGDNFSVGQRQLLSLARAMLKRSKILALDEATAAVDTGTDALIQKTIQEEFKSNTMLIIAHRLNTIIDCDRILVLNAGQVVEMDTPRNLVSKNKSMFLGMIQSTGAANAQYIWKHIMSDDQPVVPFGNN